MRNKEKYQDYLPEETESKLTSKGYINMEGEMWDGLKEDKMIPLAEQRKPMHYYFGKDYIDISEMNQNLEDMNKLSRSQIFYGNFIEDWHHYQTPEGASYWHNPKNSISTWEDPNFILSVLKSNHVENSLEMIPERWEPIEGTPFLEIRMINGKTLYIHKTFKSVFYTNPLIQQSDVKKMTDKMQKEKMIMERLKKSKMKRRLAKEQSKLKDTQEKEVPLDPPMIENDPVDVEPKQFGLRAPVMLKPSGSSNRAPVDTPNLKENKPNEKEAPEDSPDIREEVKSEPESINNPDIDPNEQSEDEAALDPNAESDDQMDPNAPSEDDEAAVNMDPNAPSDDALDLNAPSDSEDNALDPNAESDHESADQDLEEELKEQPIDVAKQAEEEFINKIKQLEQAKMDMKYSKTHKKEAKKQKFMEYLSSKIPEDDITNSSVFKEYKKILKKDEEQYKIVKKSKREAYFNEFRDQILQSRKELNPKATLKQRLELLKHKEEKRKERDRKRLEKLDPKEARKRDREDALVAFNTMLQELITDPDLPWEEASKILQQDNRFKHPSIFPEKREKLWKSHRYNLFQERKEQRNKPQKQD